MFENTLASGIKKQNEKLFTPRDIEGEKNSEALKIAREFHERLRNEKGYVGLVLQGSSIQGHYSEAGSDLDTHVLYDSSSWKKKNFLRMSVYDKNCIHELYEKIKKNIEELVGIYGKKIDVHCFDTTDINPEKIIGKIESYENDYKNFTDASVLLARILELSVGQEILNYREIFRKYLQTLSEEKKSLVKREILRYRLLSDRTSFEKKKSRNSEFSEHDTEDYLLGRKELWNKRIKSIYGI